LSLDEFRCWCGACRLDLWRMDIVRTAGCAFGGETPLRRLRWS
jgi:hypothetical protein